MAKSAKSASSGQPAGRSNLISFTFEPNTGEILKFETLDSNGQRREPSKPEKLELAREARGAGVEALLERAFEAGIACVLGGDSGPEDDRETEDEAGLRQILLKPLIEGSAVARAMRREALRQAIVQTLIQDIANSGEAEGETPKAHKSDRAAPKSST